MSHGELGQDAKPFAKVSHDLRCELGTSITDNGMGKSMILPYMEKVEFGGVQSRDGLITWDKLCLFGEAVDNGKDRVKAVGKGKIGDEVCADIHPRHCAWLKWDGRAGRFHVASFEARTPITAGYVVVDIRGQSGPVIVLFNQFLGFLVAWVSSDRGVMVRGDDVHA